MLQTIDTFIHCHLMKKLSAIFYLLLKPIAHITDESRRRTLILGFIAVVAAFFTGIIDFFHQLAISTLLDFLLATGFSILVLIDYKQWNINVKIGYLLVFNVFISLEVFVEGVATASYMYFFVAIVSMAFMLNKKGRSDPYIPYYLAFIALSYILCIYYAPQKSQLEIISDSLAREIFITNGITVIVLLSMFTYVGVKMEKDIRLALSIEKNRAEAHETKVLLQNTHLKEIAFMSAHSLRSPLTNILSISKLINIDAITSERDKLLIQHLRSSSLELDRVIHEIVAKTASANEKDNTDFVI